MAPTSRYPGRSRGLRLPLVVAVGTVVAILGVAAVSGCTSASGDGEPPCLPPAFSVNPSSAKAGGKVTVAAPDANCNPRYGQNALIQVIVTDATGVTVIDATAPMNDAGGFTYSFEVPAQTSAGHAAVTAMPYGIDWCDDTGKNNRAGGTALTLHRASCSPPTKPLSITR